MAHFDFFILTVRFAAFDEIYPQYLEIPEATVSEHEIFTSLQEAIKTPFLNSREAFLHGEKYTSTSIPLLDCQPNIHRLASMLIPCCQRFKCVICCAGYLGFQRCVICPIQRNDRDCKLRCSQHAGQFVFALKFCQGKWLCANHHDTVSDNLRPFISPQ